MLLHLFQCANRRGKLSSELRPRVRRVPVGGRSSFGGRRRHSVALQSVKQRQGIITTSGHPKPQRGTSRRAPPAPPGLFISSAKKKAPRKLCFSPPNLRDLRDLVLCRAASPSAREQVSRADSTTPREKCPKSYGACAARYPTYPRALTSGPSPAASAPCAARGMLCARHLQWRSARSLVNWATTSRALASGTSRLPMASRRSMPRCHACSSLSSS